MNLTQFLIQIVVTFVAAFLGAFLTRRTEQFKHLQELRSTAYADFLRGFARVGRAQSDGGSDERSVTEELDGRVIVTDSRSRIAIYGGRDVVHALSRFISHGTQTLTPDGMQAFGRLCMLMRAEAGMERVSPDDITRVLFN
jgi:hypothetical protein